MADWKTALETVERNLEAEIRAARRGKRRDALELQQAALEYGLKDATRHAWADNTLRLTAVLGREPTTDELAGGLRASRPAALAATTTGSSAPTSPSPPAVPAVSGDAMILRAAIRANVRSTAEQDILARASARFGETVPSLEEADSWFGELRATAPHLFVPSVGAGAAGSGAFAPNSSLDRTPYLSPEEAGRNAERIAKGLPVW